MLFAASSSSLVKFSPKPKPKPMDNIVGVGFRPTEEELVAFYLKHMLLGDDPRVNIIPVIDLCDVEPWEVPVILASSEIPFGNPAWFFFSRVDFKYSNSKRVKRTTKHGFWKPTGVDRDVRTWKTNTVIGSKKTLVYYEGRVSSGLKSIWVIYEYHAVTFNESKRKFVLCRLMKKPEKSNEGGTDTLICDEGKHSKSMVSIYENQTTSEGISSGGTFAGVETIFQPSQYFSSVQQCPISIEQEEAPSPNYPFKSAYFRNENNITQTSFETKRDEFINSNLLKNQCSSTKECFSIEKEKISFSNYPFNNVNFRNENNILDISFQTTFEDEFLNSLLADQNFITDKESICAFVNNSSQSKLLKRVHDESNDESICAFVNNSSQSKLLKRVHDESNDADVEVVSKLDCDIGNMSTKYNEYSGIDENYSLKRHKSSNVVQGDICLSSFNGETFFVDLEGMYTSSCDSSTDKHVEICCI